MKFYVYVYRDPSRKNEPIYVGKGQDDRAHSHLNRKDKHPFTHRLQLMKRDGIEPIINVVALPSEALAFQCEVDTIARLGRKDLGKGPLLNLTDGGDGVSGRVDSPETRKKRSDAKKGENNHNYGKSPSAETRQKQSDANKGENNHNYGKSPSAETRQKQSDAQKGENNHNYGKSPSADTRQKNSAAHKGKVHPKIQCPHCGKEGGVSIMHRWHFDNCKYKK